MQWSFEQVYNTLSNKCNRNAVMPCCVVDMHQISAVENPAVVPADPEVTREPTPVVMLQPLKDEYYDEWDDVSDPPDAGEIDAHNSDSSDFEQTYIKKKKKKAKANVNNVFIVKVLFQGCTTMSISDVIYFHWSSIFIYS